MKKRYKPKGKSVGCGLSLALIRRRNSSISPQNCNHGQRKCFILFIIVIGWPLSTDRSNLCIENSWQNELPFSALKRSNTFQQEKKNIFIKQNRQISLTMKVSFETKLEKLKFEFQTVNYIFYFLGLNFAG